MTRKEALRILSRAGAALAAKAEQQVRGSIGLQMEGFGSADINSLAASRMAEQMREFLEAMKTLGLEES